MAFREVPVFEVREVLRLWLRGETLRGIERLSRVGLLDFCTGDNHTSRRPSTRWVVSVCAVGSCSSRSAPHGRASICGHSETSARGAHVDDRPPDPMPALTWP